jgi:hypothetical protein
MPGFPDVSDCVALIWSKILRVAFKNRASPVCSYHFSQTMAICALPVTHEYGAVDRHLLSNVAGKGFGGRSGATLRSS